MNIIIVSNEPWGDIWFSKHHYANELSKTNRVVFMNPCKSWNPLNLFKYKIVKKEISPNLWVLNYYNFLPHYFLKLNNRIVTSRIRKFLLQENFKVNIFWSFDPIRLFDPALFKTDISIFHAVDKYKFTFPAELILLLKVDAFLVVSKDFVNSYQKYDKPILVKPHGISSDEFELNETDFKIELDDYILYLGTIDFRLDFPFISRMIKRFPDQKFVFLGGMRGSNDPLFKDLFFINKPNNLIILPAIHAQKVKYYINKAKCCIAPMIKSLDGNLISHHKTLQYIAHGKEVFSPIFTEYLSWKHLLYMENDENLLLEKMNLFLNEGEDQNLKVERIKLAQKHQYSILLNDIFDFLNKLNK